MKSGPLWFTFVPHKDGSLSRHLDVGLFSSKFGFPSVSGPFLRSGEYLGRPRELVDIVEVGIVYFSLIIFQVQYDGAYPLGFDDPPDAIDLRIVPRIHGFKLCV